MQRFYEFPYNDLKNVILSPESHSFQSDIKIALPLVRMFLGNNPLTVESIGQNDDVEHIFKSKTEEVKVNCHDDLYFIYYGEKTIGFSYDFSNGNIIYEIKFYSELYEDEMLVEKFKPHSDDILIAHSSRELELFLPLDTTETIDIKIFDETEGIDDIETLKRFYFTHFFNIQTTYDKKELSILRIYRVISDCVYLTDELILSEGFIRSYLISLVEDDFILSVKKPKDGFQEFVFNKIPQADLDINALARKLSKQASAINFRL